MRLAVKTDIEQDLARKGFQQVSDPAAAEFLVDYHVGIRRATETVARPVRIPRPRLRPLRLLRILPLGLLGRTGICL